MLFHARDDLAAKVEWVAETCGDGLGFDVLSFDEADDSEWWIEVKTTGLGKHFPFYVTANEVRCSEDCPDRFRLYRVFDFARNPRDLRRRRVPSHVSAGWSRSSVGHRSVEGGLPGGFPSLQDSCLRMAICGFNALSSRTMPSIMASWASGHFASSLLHPRTTNVWATRQLLLASSRCHDNSPPKARSISLLVTEEAVEDPLVGLDVLRTSVDVQLDRALVLPDHVVEVQAPHPGTRPERVVLAGGDVRHGEVVFVEARERSPCQNRFRMPYLSARS